MNLSPSLPVSPVVAVVGATGLVGHALLRALEEHELLVGDLRAMARGGMRTVPFRGEEVRIEEIDRDRLASADLVFFAATGELSRELAPVAVAGGARVIDKSSVFRGDPGVPLVVPEVNGELVGPGTRLVASPNCTTIGLVLALEPIRRAAGLRRVVVTTLQAASGAGRRGLAALAERGSEEEVFPRPLAGNVLPVCEAVEEDGSSSEERKLLAESRRILGLGDLELSVTCTRVPVAVGHSAAVTVWTEEPLSVEAARAVFERAEGVRLSEFPTPKEAQGGVDVLVGRIRRAPGSGALQFFEAFDNLRRGAATNAVGIAVRMGLG